MNLEANEMIRAAYEDGKAEINGREYVFTAMSHKQRRRVCTYFTSVQSFLHAGDLSFIDSAAFEPIEAIINKTVMFGGSLLDRLGDAHWELHPEDYFVFISAALAVISYPFTAANRTD